MARVASKRKPPRSPLANGAAQRKKRSRPNQAGRPTAAELERRKKKVMEVATDLFVSQGFSATSLVDIAKGAGVATRTLYQHFGDKEAMFREVIFARDTAVIIEPPAVENGDTLVSLLNRMGHYACDVALQQRSVGLMRLMIAESNRFPELMQRVATATFSRFRGRVTRLFDDMARLGLIPEGDNARRAELFVDLILGCAPIMSYMNWAVEPPTAHYIAARVDLFINGAFEPAVARKAATRAVKLNAA